jgi:hypothetical protein
MKDCVRTGRRAMVRPRQLIIPISMLTVEPWSFAALLGSAQLGEYAQGVSIIQRAQAGQAITNQLLRGNFVAQGCVVLQAIEQRCQFCGCQVAVQKA